MYRTTRGSEQRRLQCLQDIQKLQEEIKLLQISNEKLNGVGLDDMSFTELASLGSMLDEGFRIVDEQLDNVVGAHEEITTKQNREEDLAYQSLLAGRRVALRNKAREFRLSPPETQPWRSDDPERLVKTIDSLEMEKERLRLFNQRMLGKELDGMSYSELFVFSFEISGAIMKVVSMKKIKRDEEMGKTKRPRPSVNVRHQNVTLPQRCLCIVLGYFFVHVCGKDVSFAYQARLSSRRTAVRNKSRELRLRRMIGKELDGMSYAELYVLGFDITRALMNVMQEMDKIKHAARAYYDFATMQIVESVVMGMDWTDKLEKEDLAYQARLSRRRTAVRNKSRELRLSPQDSQQEHSHDHEELMLTIESLKIEKKRLLLLSQRMIGKELDGMSYAELYVLGFDITRALMNVMQEMDKIKHAARVSKESISLDTTMALCD
ncbi:unnamed protein product [Brassica oleracea]